MHPELLNDIVALCKRRWAPGSGCPTEAPANVETLESVVVQLAADLVSCRATVKTELHHYERQAIAHGKTPHGAAYEAEARRLNALLDRIDGLALWPNVEVSGLRSKSA